MSVVPTRPTKSSKWSRTSTLRSKSGCLTCRARHVKCDEGKPHCQKCVTSGRTCDFFQSESQAPSSSLAGIISTRSARERRYLDYFRHRTIPDLSGYDIYSHFWNYVVLQASHSSPAVLHGALALGALHEQMDGSASIIDEKTNRFLLQQANKSIRSLCNTTTGGNESSLETALICCILFICLSNAQGDHESALRHLQSGLNMLSEWRLQQDQKITTQSGTSAQEVFTQVFCRLDMQATTYLDSRPPRMHGNSFREIPAHLACLPKSFGTLTEAQIALEGIEIRAFYSLTTKRGVGAEARKSLLRGLENRFQQWHMAFEALLSGKNGDMSTKELQLAVLLKLHYKTMSLMVRVKAAPDFKSKAPKANPDWEREYLAIVSAAKSLISCSSATSNTFTADTGIIAPLYFTAMHTRESSTRREAIHLMRRWKRREGFWDGETAARISGVVGQWVDMGVEEEGDGDLFLGGVPDLERICWGRGFPDAMQYGEGGDLT